MGWEDKKARMVENKQFDPTKPVQTRDGYKTRIICTDAKGDYPIVALVTHGEVEVAWAYRSDGKLGYGQQHSDLINVPERHPHWRAALERMWVDADGQEIEMSKWEEQEARMAEAQQKALTTNVNTTCYKCGDRLHWLVASLPDGKVFHPECLPAEARIDPFKDLRARAEAAERERDKLRYAILGGEDAPGHAASVSIADTLKCLERERYEERSYADSLRALLREAKPVVDAFYGKHCLPRYKIEAGRTLAARIEKEIGDD